MIGNVVMWRRITVLGVFSIFITLNNGKWYYVKWCYVQSNPFHLNKLCFFWVLPPKNFPVENFRWRSDLRKFSVFHEFSFHVGKKNRRPATDSILMPPTFHIARLNRYTPNFSGVPQKLTWCQQFGLQIFPKWGDADICRLEMAVFRCFFLLNKFSPPNGRLSPIACHTYLESYGF